MFMLKQKVCDDVAGHVGEWGEIKESLKMKLFLDICVGYVRTHW